DTVPEVFIEQPQRDGLQRAVDGADLSEDVDAVFVLLDHLRDAADLTLDPAQAFGVVVLVRRIAVRCGHFQPPSICFIWPISASCVVTMFFARVFASTLSPLAISALAIAIAPWW